MEKIEKAAGAAQITRGKDNQKDHLNEQCRKLLTAFQNGEKLSSVDITIRYRIADPRSLIRHLRNKGYQITDEWIYKENTRYKMYFIKAES